MRNIARTLDVSLEATFDVPQASLEESGSASPNASDNVGEVTGSTDAGQFFDEFDAIAARIATLDAECKAATTRYDDGLWQEAARLYVKALALRESTALWTSLIALPFWNGRSGRKPKPEDQYTRALHFAFMLGYGAREEDERKRASKHAKALQPLFEQGASEAEALQFLRTTGGFEGAKRREATRKEKAPKAQPTPTAADEKVQSGRLDVPGPDPEESNANTISPSQGADTPDTEPPALIIKNNSGVIVDPNDLQPKQRVHIVAYRSDDDGPPRLLAAFVSIDAVFDPNQE